MEFGLAPFVLQKIRSVVSRYPQVDKVAIYGSRATGNFKPSSDIDIAVYAPHMTREEFGKLRFEIDELPLIFTMDIVHYDALQNEGLKQKICRDAKFVYPEGLMV